MDFLIKNMEIPKNGTLTLVVHPNGDVYLGDVLKDIKIGKIIELPPHGDLIDKQKLLEWQNITCIDTGAWQSDFDAVKTSVIKNAPVVVKGAI